jgi:hypothetical protein
VCRVEAGGSIGNLLEPVKTEGVHDVGEGRSSILVGDGLSTVHQ